MKSLNWAIIGAGFLMVAIMFMHLDLPMAASKHACKKESGFENGLVMLGYTNSAGDKNNVT